MAKLEFIEDVAVVSPACDIDRAEMSAVRNAVSEALGRGVARVVLDLSGVDHVNYVTLGVLVERRLRLRSCGGDLLLAGPSDYLVKLLRFAGVHDHFEIHASVSEAVESFLEEEEAIALAGQSGSWVPRMS